MQIINTKTLYRCEICGATSENKEMIEQCEKKGKPQPIVNEGDIIYFKDCKETPLLYGKEVDGYFSFNFRLPKYIQDVVDRARVFFNVLSPYRVKKVEIKGHNISYILGGIKGKSADWTSVDYGSGNTFHYPTIDDNELMQKILEKYNKK